MRRWVVLTVLLLPMTLLVWLKHAGGQTLYTAAIYHPNGTQSVPNASADTNQDAWPDDPFTTLTDNDLWLASISGRTVAALRWSTAGTGVQEIDLDLARPDGLEQRVLIQAPDTLVVTGEVAVLLVGIAQQLEPLLGSNEVDESALLAGHDLVRGGLYIEISVLISADNGITFDEIEPARLTHSPIRLRIENLIVNTDTIPVLYEHPTYIDSDSQSGLEVLAEIGEWLPVSCVTLANDDRAADDETYPAYLEADLHSLSVFAPMVPVQDDDGGDTSGEGQGGEVENPNGGGLGGTSGSTIDGGEFSESLGDGESLNDFSSDDGGGEGLALLLASEVYVDFEYVGAEDGTELHPFNSLTEAIVTVQENGMIFVAPGVTHETLTQVSKPLSMQLWSVTRQTNTATIGDITSCGPDIDSFSTSTPAAAPFLDLAGDADPAPLGSGVYLVPQLDSQAGAVWTRRKVVVARGFAVSFTFNLNHSSGIPDSDGISFVIQTAGAPSLTTGGNMGYTGISNSVAVEFDHWSNPQMNDPESQHVAIQSGGLGGANSASHSPEYEIALGSANFVSGLNSARIVYDPRAQTLAAYMNGSGTPAAVAHGFLLENYMNLDDGSAYIGVVATTGVEADTYGPALLSSFSASFPQSCEEVFWEKPLVYSSYSGYSGDTFDHRITGNFLQSGDVIRETITHLWDDVGLKEADIAALNSEADGVWRVINATRHGISGLWRWRSEADENLVGAEFDDHQLNSNRSVYDATYDGSGLGTVVLLQTMTFEDTGIVVARNQITFKLIKMDPAFTAGGATCFDGSPYRFHMIVQKQNASNTSMWAEANEEIPQIPCP